MKYEFDSFVVNQNTRDLFKNGSNRKIEPQVFDVLIYLIANRYRIVSKDELVDAVWGGRAISDAAINSRVRSARNALGDSGREQSYIKTVYGTGFRFIGSVRKEEAQKALIPDVDHFDTDTKFTSRPALAEADIDVPRVTKRPMPRIYVWLALLGIVGILIGSIANLVMGPASTETQIAVAPPKPRIAILAYRTYSPTDQDKYFSVSLAERLINNFSDLDGVEVISPISSFAFDPQKLPPMTEILDALNVDFVIEGSLEIDGSQILLTNRLVDMSSGRIIWSKEYDRPLTPETLISYEWSVTEEVRTVLSLTEKANTGLRRQPQSAKAYEALAQAEYYRSKPRSEATLKNAISAYTTALNIDPELIDALAGRAVARLELDEFVENGFDDLYERSGEDAQTAILLSPENPDAIYAKALWMYETDEDSEQALQLFKQALRQQPNHVMSYYNIAEIHAFENNNLDAAMTALEKALRFDPLNPRILQLKTRLLENSGQFTEALAVAEQNYKWNPHTSDAIYYLVIAHESAQSYAKGYYYLMKAHELGTGDKWLQHNVVMWTHSLYGAEAAGPMATTLGGKATLYSLTGEEELATNIIQNLDDPFLGMPIAFMMADFELVYQTLAPTGYIESVASIQNTFDNSGDMYIFDQEDLMVWMIVHAAMRYKNHPEATRVAQLIHSSLQTIQDKEIYLHLYMLAAAWYTFENQPAEAFYWLEKQAEDYNYPFTPWLNSKAFAPLKNHSDYERVSRIFLENAKVTRDKYEALLQSKE